MSRLDRINLIFGIVGLLANASVLVVFASSVIGTRAFEPATPTGMSLPVRIASGLVLVYSWLAISWYAARRKLPSVIAVVSKSPKKKRADAVSVLVGTSVVGVGLILFPLGLIWFYLIGLDSLASASASSAPLVPPILDAFFGAVLIMSLVGFGIFIAVAALLLLVDSDA